MRRQPTVISSALFAALFLSACWEGVTAVPCDVSGTGNLTVNITGVPAGLDAKVLVNGPGIFTVLTATTTLTGISGGPYAITSAPIEIADTTVSGYIRGALLNNSVCLKDGESPIVNVPHSAIGSAGKVWVGSGFYSLAFTSTQLRATATLAPTVTSGTRGSAGAAFDLNGNLWVRGLTGEPYLMRYTAASLATTANPLPDRMINISGVTCEGSGALAFDESGNLWVSIGCQGRVLRLGAGTLAVSGTLIPDVQITGLVQPEGLAFDALGNLWVADGTHLRRFDAARLGASITTAADLRVTFTTPSPPTPGATALNVRHLAFSPTGELWVSTYSQHSIYRVEAAVVAAVGAQTTAVTRIIYFDPSAQPRGFAFDNSGGVFIAYLGQSFARLSPLQLQSSVLLPNTITPGKTYATASILGFAENVVLFPAPAATPLYSRAR